MTEMGCCVLFWQDADQKTHNASCVQWTLTGCESLLSQIKHIRGGWKWARRCDDVKKLVCDCTEYILNKTELVSGRSSGLTCVVDILLYRFRKSKPLSIFTSYSVPLLSSGFTVADEMLWCSLLLCGLISIYPSFIAANRKQRSWHTILMTIIMNDNALRTKNHKISFVQSLILLFKMRYQTYPLHVYAYINSLTYTDLHVCL